MFHPFFAHGLSGGSNTGLLVQEDSVSGLAFAAEPVAKELLALSLISLNNFRGNILPARASVLAPVLGPISSLN
jgi:hypothetical protein